VANLGKTTTAATDGEAALNNASLSVGQTPLQNLETTLLLKTLVTAAVSSDAALSVTSGKCQTPTKTTYPANQTSALREEVAIAELPCLLAGPGNRASPTGRRISSECALSLPPRVGASLCVERAFSTSPCDV
jgi:hypothetical protein